MTVEHATYAPDGLSVTVELSQEYTFNGAPTRSLTMRRGRLRDQRAAVRAVDNLYEREVWLIAHLCEVPPDGLDELIDTDYKRLQDAYVGFQTRS